MTEADQTHASEAPRDLLEQWLANTWAFRFGKKEISRDADFFDDLGGSLITFEVFANIESRLDVTMSLAKLFQTAPVELATEGVTQTEIHKVVSILSHAGFVDVSLHIGKEGAECRRKSI
jgi:acyl carrier protein